MSIRRKIYYRVFNTIDKHTPPVSVRKGGRKRALISYILTPFRIKKGFLHCNAIESIQMADTLADLDYSVDVVDYRFKGRINYNKYDLVIGFGYPYRNSFQEANKEITRICYMTGANPNFSNYAEAKRINSFQRRKGIYLAPKREVYWPWVFGAINADALVVVGNQWTAHTYEGLNDKVFTVPVPYICKPEELELKPEATKSFVWFAGPGAVHKGLDLVIEAVVQSAEDVMLHICGNLKNESAFLNCYQSELLKTNRIRIWGMIGPDSTHMQEICSGSAFVLFPSCSEGTASSVITCMAKGLIPVVTKESGIDLPDFGLEISDGSVNEVARAI
ncbi:MAG TPA: glycosyltransferase, partial [Bacteroidia bacterium]